MRMDVGDCIEAAWICVQLACHHLQLSTGLSQPPRVEVLLLLYGQHLAALPTPSLPFHCLFKMGED